MSAVTSYDSTPARGVRVTAQQGHVGMSVFLRVDDRRYIFTKSEARRVAQALTAAADHAGKRG